MQQLVSCWRHWRHVTHKRRRRAADAEGERVSKNNLMTYDELRTYSIRSQTPAFIGGVASGMECSCPGICRGGGQSGLSIGRLCMCAPFGETLQHPSRHLLSASRPGLLRYIAVFVVLRWLWGFAMTEKWKSMRNYIRLSLFLSYNVTLFGAAIVVWHKILHTHAVRTINIILVSFVGVSVK